MYIYLDFIEDFACEMCGACCRKEWLVTLDEASYQRNRALFARQGREKEFSQAFIQLAQPGQPGEYAKIAKKPTGGCWFLSEDNCCVLHREAGHEHLDAVCQTFPRYPMLTSRGMEFTLSFSCPAVLKLVRREEPLTVIRRDAAPLLVPAGQAVLAVHPKQQPQTSPLRHYYELEHHFIDILQCRQLTIEERLSWLRQTVAELTTADQDDFPRPIDAKIRRNYEQMDALPVEEQQTGFSAAILLEHFLVNFIFKKAFYIHGLQGGMTLLELCAAQVQQACYGTEDKKEQLELAAAAIRQLEFEYGHNREALLRVTAEEK